MPAYKIVLSSTWPNAMLLVLVININTLAFDYHNIADDVWFHSAWVAVADGFFYWYWCEALFKIFALGPRGYFAAPIRQFEFMTLMASVAERSTSSIEINPMVLRVSLRESNPPLSVTLSEGRTYDSLVLAGAARLARAAHPARAAG